METNKHSIKTVIKHHKKRHHHHEHRRSKKISQKIELKKQHFQCVINLNTTICEHEANRSKLNTKVCKCVSQQHNCTSHKVSSLVREPISLTSQSQSRIAPYCFREKCRIPAAESLTSRKGLVKQCKCQKIRKTREHVKDTLAKHHHHNSRKHRQETRSTVRASRLPVRYHKHKNDSLHLSPISSSPLKDDLNHLYEDISNDSLDEVLKTPKSYKNIRYVEDKVESKLDTLIKRTKERERKQVAQSRTVPMYSLSSASDMSSGECPMDLGSVETISLHSRSTLVLEKSQSDFIYLSSDTEKSLECSRSPKSEFYINIPRKYEYGLYSPGSPSKNDFSTNLPRKYELNQKYSTDFNMNIPKKYQGNLEDNIKSEPILYTRTYSPTFDYSKEEIKKEIEFKSESFENDIEQFDFAFEKEVYY